MKYQPIPRLGLSVYPEKKQISDQTIVSLIKSFIVPPCLIVWHGVYRLFKLIL